MNVTEHDGEVVCHKNIQFCILC